MTITFFNCSPHGALEESFWSDVSRALSAAGIHLIMDHPGDVESSLLRVSYGPGIGSLPLEPVVDLTQEYLDCSRRWGPGLDAPAYQQSLRRIQQTLHLTKPSLVLIWNGFHPENVIVRALCQQVGCPVAFVERTPWAGCVSLDTGGILADCSFLQCPRDWGSAAQREEALIRYGLYRDAICRQGITWWQQPDSSTAAIAPRTQKPVILFPGQVDWDSQTFAFSPFFSSNLEAFRWTVGQLASNSDFHLLGKQHPKSDTPVDLYTRQIPNGMGEWRSDLPLDEIWPVVTGVISVNSSVLGEALMRGIPAFRLGRTMLDSCTALSCLTRLDEPGPLHEWLESLRQRRSGSVRIEDPAWVEFSAYHLDRNLYCVPDIPGVRDSRGPSKFAAQLLTHMSSTSRWDDAFPVPWVVRHHFDITRKLATAARDHEQLAEVRQSRPINAIIRIRNRFAASPILQDVTDIEPPIPSGPDDVSRSASNPNDRNPKAMFVWIPKSAGTSVWTTFESVYGEKFLDLEVIKRHGALTGLTTFGHISVPGLIEAGLMDPAYFQTSFKFTIVRNPFDRAISLYEYQIKTAALPAGTTFSIFCRYLVERAYETVGLYNRKGLSQLNPQVAWLRDSSGRIFVDYIGRFESLAVDLNRIRDHLGLAPLQGALPWRRRSQRRTRLEDYFGPTEIQAVREAYAEDFQLLGYDDTSLPN